MTTSELRTASFETLHSGAIVKWDVPGKAVLRQLKQSDGAVALEYLHSAIFLPGGAVNVQVHTSDTSVRGSTIRAMVEIKIKTTANGKDYLTVDLHPVDDEIRATHRLVIVEDKFEQKSGWLVFPTPNLNGLVALIEPNEKLVPVAEKYRDGKTNLAAGKDRRINTRPIPTQAVEGNRPFADALADITK